MGKSSTIFQVQFRWLFNTNASPNLNKHYLNLIFSIIFYQRHSMEWPLNISRCRVGRLRLLNVRLLNLFHKMLKTILLKLRTSFTFLVSKYFSLSLFTKMVIYIWILLSILSVFITNLYSRMDWCWPSTRRCYYQNVIGKPLALGSQPVR